MGIMLLGYAYLEKKDHAQAVEAFTKAIYYHSKDPAGYCDLAYVYLLLENLEACKRNLKKAIELDPNQKKILANDSCFQKVMHELI